MFCWYFKPLGRQNCPFYISYEETQTKFYSSLLNMFLTHCSFLDWFYYFHFSNVSDLNMESTMFWRFRNTLVAPIGLLYKIVNKETDALLSENLTFYTVSKGGQEDVFTFKKRLRNISLYWSYSKLMDLSAQRSGIIRKWVFHHLEGH